MTAADDFIRHMQGQDPAELDRLREEAWTDARRSGPATGRCPVCHRDGLRIRKNGTIWNHGNGVTSLGDPRHGQNCPGAGQNPEEAP